jgi:hypothetical protein
MNTNTKVRVRTADLLAAVKARKVAEDKAVAKAREEYPAKMEAYRAAVVKELRDAADKIERGGKVPTARYSAPGIRFKAECPAPYERDKTLARTIATLEMAADDAIAITAQDYARYLG